MSILYRKHFTWLCLTFNFNSDYKGGNFDYTSSGCKVLTYFPQCTNNTANKLFSVTCHYHTFVYTHLQPPILPNFCKIMECLFIFNFGIFKVISLCDVLSRAGDQTKGNRSRRPCAQTALLTALPDGPGLYKLTPTLLGARSGPVLPLST
jgi:hypothetical protein